MTVALGVRPVLVRKVRLGSFRSGLPGAPWNQLLHLAGEPALFKLVLEDAMDLRVLVLILDLTTAFLAADLTGAEHGGVERLPAGCRVLAGKALVHHQVGGGSCAYVEVLMQPLSLAGTRKIKTAFFPVATDAWLAASLGQYIAFTLGNIEVRPGTVPVRFLVMARFETGDVRLHHSGAHDHERVRTTAASALPFVERQLLDIRDK